MEGIAAFSSFATIVGVLHAVSTGSINVGIAIIISTIKIIITIVITIRTDGIQIVLLIHLINRQGLPIGCCIQEEQSLLGHFENSAHR